MVDLTKCLHGNGPECERCKAMDIPEVEEMEAEITSLRASLASAEERAAKAEQERDVWQESLKLSAKAHDDLAKTVAGLRGALEHIRRWEGMKHREDTAEVCYSWCPLCRIEAALAASPAEHAARIQAAALREAWRSIAALETIPVEDMRDKHINEGIRQAMDVVFELQQIAESEADRLAKAVVA